MVTWAKEEIELQGGAKALAQMPVIVSASRSTDIPAFYADWFMARLKDPGLCSPAAASCPRTSASTTRARISATTATPTPATPR